MLRCFVFAIIAVFMISCSSDNCITGNNNYMTYEYDLADFHSVENPFAGTVKLHSGEAKVSAYIESNIADLIEYKINDQFLKIGSKDDCFDANDIYFDIYAQNFNTLENDGSADWTSDFLEFDPNIISNGSGSFKIKGKSDKQAIELNGSGDVDLLDMPTKTANVKTNGSGDTFLMVSENADVIINGSGDVYIEDISGSLKVEINGSGDLHYSGEPQEKVFILNGSGKVIKK